MSNKTLEETLQPYVEKALNGIEKGAEFALDMAPELLQEFYMWHFWSSIFWITFGLLLIIAGIIIATRVFKRKNLSGNAHIALFTVDGIAPILIGLIFVTYNLCTIVYMSVAPKLYLLDYFMN